MIDKILLVLIICLVVWVVGAVWQQSEFDTLEADFQKAQINSRQIALGYTGKAMAEKAEKARRDIMCQDLTLITRVVMAEARGQGYEGMVGVAQVIYDRSTAWGLTPKMVVTASGQFATPYDGEITDEAVDAVTGVFMNNVRAFPETTTHFYSGLMPYWAGDKIVRGRIGAHTFMGSRE